MRLCAAATARLSLSEVVTQRHGAVVNGVVRAVEQGHGALARRVEDRLPTRRIRVELGLVPSLKLVPALDPMIEPFPELRSRCDFLHPHIGT
jgi:hypothetical protein